MIDYLIISLIERGIAFLIMIILVLPKSWQQTKVDDPVSNFRWGIWFGLTIYTISNVLYPGIVNFCTKFDCHQNWMTEIGPAISGLGNIAIAIILYIFYYVL